MSWAAINSLRNIQFSPLPKSNLLSYSPHFSSVPLPLSLVAGSLIGTYFRLRNISPWRSDVAMATSSPKSFNASASRNMSVSLQESVPTWVTKKACQERLIQERLTLIQVFVLFVYLIQVRALRFNITCLVLTRVIHLVFISGIKIAIDCSLLQHFWCNYYFWMSFPGLAVLTNFNVTESYSWYYHFC